MRSYYWWNDFKVKKVSHSNLRRRVSTHPNYYPAEVKREIYSSENAWFQNEALGQAMDGGRLPIPIGPRPTLRRFLRLFAGQLLGCLFWASVCVIITVVYGKDFFWMGIPCILYFGVLGIGLVVSVGLPVKWYRDYRSTGGIIAGFEDSM